MFRLKDVVLEVVLLGITY